jgi:aryl sulfotransferase
MSANEITSPWPAKTAEFQDPHMDSTRWNDFVYREGDIVIGTWAKSGTTWLQQIVSQFVFDGAEGIPVLEISPWLEYRPVPIDSMFSMLETQQHRRFLKTHLPADVITSSPLAQYIYVARDGRDALWSWYEFHCSYTDSIYQAVNETVGRIGPPFPRPGPDVIEYFHHWLDGNGYPAWPFFSNIQSWWNVRDQPNVLLLHFNNLKSDLDGEMRKIGNFLNFEVDGANWAKLVEHCTFDYMSKNADQLTPRLATRFTDGARSLINKGTNARWRDILSDHELEKYQNCVAKNLSLSCARWLETGEQQV